MKHILILGILFIIVGCSSKAEKMTSSMEPFMTENFPDATFEIIIKDSLHQLIINDKKNLVNEDNSDEIMTKTLGNFHKVFYKYSNGVATNSVFNILYENETSTWRSDTYTLKELGEMYNR